MSQYSIHSTLINAMNRAVYTMTTDSPPQFPSTLLLSPEAFQQLCADMDSGPSLDFAKKQWQGLAIIVSRDVESFAFATIYHQDGTQP